VVTTTTTVTVAAMGITVITLAVKTTTTIVVTGTQTPTIIITVIHTTTTTMVDFRLFLTEEIVLVTTVPVSLVTAIIVRNLDTNGMSAGADSETRAIGGTTIRPILARTRHDLK
jgi:hypothetical protein